MSLTISPSNSNFESKTNTSPATDINSDISSNNLSETSSFLKSSPMLDQYLALKNQVPQAVLLFRSGDFYEMFGKEALKMAAVLDIRQTTRNKNDPDNSVELCGFPYRSSKTYIQKLLKLGYKVAIAEQMQSSKDPTVKGLIKRQIVKIYTPGCQDEISDEEEQNFIVAVYQNPGSTTWTVLVSDVSTGELKISTCRDDQSVLDLIYYIKPKEILARKFILEEMKDILKTYLNYNKYLCFSIMEEEPLRNNYYQQEVVQKICARNQESLSIMDKCQGSYPLLAGFIKYLEFLHINTDRFLSIKPIKEPDTMVLTEIERRDLELFETIRTSKTTGSLYYEIKRTLTPVGSRLLRRWILYPLMNLDEIKKRQDACESLINIFKNNMDVFFKLKEILTGFSDLERLAIKLTTGVLSSTQILTLRSSLLKTVDLFNLMQSIKDRLSCLLSFRIEDLSLFNNALDLFNLMIKEDASDIGHGDLFIKEGYDPELDEYNNLSKHGETKILEYEKKLREDLDFPLKIKKHASMGLMIEVSKNKSDRVPSYFIKRQSMTNFDRYSTDDLSKLSTDILSAEEMSLQKEQQLFLDFISKLKPFYVDLIKISQAVSCIDVIFSFAQCSMELNYIRPIFSQRIHIEGSRHPSIERLIGDSFTSNNITIEDPSRIMLITGPNMGGKSTVMRQVALSVILAQIGSFVPASYCELPIFDRIFTRVGASDDISAGQSTFMVEMSQTASILRNATKRSLIILDEIGRGTSTQDGLALASAILEDLSINKKAYCFFTTHYHELVSFSTQFSNISIYQTQVIQENSKVMFTHKLIPGACGKSFGIEVAKLAGIPQNVIKRATALQNIYLGTNHIPQKENESDSESKSESTTTSSSTSISELLEQKSSLDINSSKNLDSNTISLNKASSTKLPGCLFKDSTDKITQILDKLRTININKTTPIKALTILDDMKSLINDDQTKNQLSLFE